MAKKEVEGRLKEEAERDVVAKSLEEEKCETRKFLKRVRQ